MIEDLHEARTRKRLERTSEYLSQQDTKKAEASARLAHQILDEIIAAIRPDMLESDVKTISAQRFEAHGIEELWHPPYVRFGKHTLLTFMDKAQENMRLSKEDIAFVDIGIVKDGMEGDAGRTVTFGNNAEYLRVAQASKTIFDAALNFWQVQNPTGIALYEYIYAQAEKLNVKWNLDPAGHLIGAFPHRGWKRGINHYPDRIESGKWILEIQLRHPELPFGAFYEDLLYKR